MKAVNCAVVPEPSDRTTGRIGRFGSWSCGLSLAMLGSSQFVITPVKIFVSSSGVSRRLVTSWPLIVEVVHERRAAGDVGHVRVRPVRGERDLVR